MLEVEPVATPIFASGHFVHQSRMKDSSVVAALRPPAHADVCLRCHSLSSGSYTYLQSWYVEEVQLNRA
jgi:hypothetical protein